MLELHSNENQYGNFSSNKLKMKSVYSPVSWQKHTLLQSSHQKIF